MGIFSGISKAFDGGGLDKLLRARSIMQGDYGSAARITHGMREDQRARAEAEQKKQARESVYQGLVEQGVPEAQALIMSQNIEAAGKTQAELWGERARPRQFGPEGGSVAVPDGQGGYRTGYTAQAWQNGTLFGSTPGGNVAPQILMEAEKAIPIEAGGAVAGLKPYTGGARGIFAPNYGQGSFGQPAGGSGGIGGNATPAVPPAAADYLRTHPETWQQFEEKYGPGTARAVLGIG